VKLDEINANSICLYIIDNVEIDDITVQLNSLNLKYSLDAGKFKESCSEIQSQISIYSPDELLNNLEKRNIKYIIIPKLRQNPDEAGSIINTIHHYLLFIDMKYPNRFIVIHEIGDSESCELVEYTPNGIPTSI
jgi:hypothetical protein